MLTVAVIGLLLAAGCAPSAFSNNTSTDTEPVRPRLRSEVVTVVTESPTVLPDEPEGPDRAEEILASMSIEEKVGQLFMPVFYGSDANTPSETEKALNHAVFGLETPSEVIAHYKLGGVIYLGDNIVTADQVGEFSAGLQASALDDTGIGLLIAVDQEGGRVNRLTDGVTVFPSAALLSGDREAVREAGYVTGRQVTVQGINVVLAPVADVTESGTSGAIGNRSYGDDPFVVADMVTAAVEGLQSGGVAAAVKHWPGHGATGTDSHVALPVLDIGRPAWDERERIPFAAAIDENVAIVLVGHLSLPSMDPGGGPASASTVLIDELLREGLGFDGVVMTDALNMGAVANVEPGELVVQSLAAGADILLVPPDLPTAYNAVLDAVQTGRLTSHRIDQAVLRVLRLKDDLALLPPTADRR